MNDLSGLDWTSNSQQPKQPNSLASLTLATLRPTPPVSGRSTPLNASFAASKPTTPANDNFSSLVSFNSSSTSRSLTLQDQQRNLVELRAQQDARRRQELGTHYSVGDEHFWDNLGSGRTSPALASYSQARTATSTAPRILSQARKQDANADEDFLAVLDASAPVESSIYLPKHFIQRPLQSPATSRRPPGLDAVGTISTLDDGDDPFGLREVKPARTSQQDVKSYDDDDVLGLLGKPMSQTARLDAQPLSKGIRPEDEHPQDKAIAELMDMGFPAEKARQALESTETRLDVQAAVGWLLTQAHSESRQESRAKRRGVDFAPQRDERFTRRSDESHRDLKKSDAPSQARPRSERRPESDRDQSNHGTSASERDPSSMATDFGTTFLKTAGSIWKTGTKTVQQAVQDFNPDSDSSQPRWLKNPQNYKSGATPRHRRRSSAAKERDVTDEAIMLELDRGHPRRSRRPKQEPPPASIAEKKQDRSPAAPSRLREAAPQVVLTQQPPSASKASLNRRIIEDQASQIYVSSVRRRKPAVHRPASASEPDLLESLSQPALPSRPATTQPPGPVKVAAFPRTGPTRAIPEVSQISLRASDSQRESGTAHFKRGDYSAAHQSYAAALSHLPPSHPIAIVLLTNHALTALKIGEPKTAISDTDRAMTLIGALKGESETIDLRNGEVPKPMREFYGKALMRKAEGLEQMERWKNAAAVWKEAVESGHGGATSIQGRIRAQNAASPQPVRQKPTKKAEPKRSALNDLGGRSSAAAVNRLRAANAAAEKADVEKFALADSVGTKLLAWRGGKADNLRALLGSLDTVLWPEAGWKKIGMADLVVPGKVKVQYMRGIAKVHPDKVCRSCTTLRSR